GCGSRRRAPFGIELVRSGSITTVAGESPVGGRQPGGKTRERVGKRKIISGVEPESATGLPCLVGCTLGECRIVYGIEDQRRRGIPDAVGSGVPLVIRHFVFVDRPSA